MMTASPNKEDHPQSLMHQAMDLFARPERVADPKNVERIPATLLVDSSTDGPLQGFRSFNATPRLMIYEARDYEISLSIDSHLATPKPVMAIIGQAMIRKPDMDIGTVGGAQVELWNGTRMVSATKSDEFGLFDLGGISEGVYHIKIKSGAKQIEIPELQAIV